MKRYRTPTTKAGQLLIKYGQERGDHDLYFCYGGGGATKRDSRLLSFAFERDLGLGFGTLRQELEARGYDITTLKFSVMKRTEEPTTTGITIPRTTF